MHRLSGQSDPGKAVEIMHRYQKDICHGQTKEERSSHAKDRGASFERGMLQEVVGNSWQQKEVLRLC